MHDRATVMGHGHGSLSRRVEPQDDMFGGDHLIPGRIELANGSRAAIDRFGAAYADLVVLEITARPAIIASRLAGRGRETAPEIKKLLARDTGDWRADCQPIRIDNSGALDDAEERLHVAIEALRNSKD